MIKMTIVYIRRLTLKLLRECYENCDVVEDINPNIPVKALEAWDVDYDDKYCEIDYCDFKAEVPDGIAKQLEKEKFHRGTFKCKNGHTISYYIVV